MKSILNFFSYFLFMHLLQVARINDQVLAIQTENENGIEVPWNKTCFK